MIEFINNYLIPGLVLGSIYALGAIGVSMIFAILRFAHFAHGDLMTLGAYLALAIVAALDWPPILAMPFALAATVVVALGVDRFAYRPFRKSRPIVVVMASFGVALMLRSVVMLVWGVQPAPYENGIVPPLESLEPFRIQVKHVIILGTAVVLVVLLHLLLTRTKMGKAMRAMSDDADLARITGINTERVITWTWVVGAVLAGAAGILTGIDTQLKPTLGWDLLLPLFAAAILGGLGKPYGAILGGLIIGVIEELSSYPLFSDDPLIPPGYKTGLAFALMVIMLIWRPQGLLRGRLL
ncbi:MAG: branched-chain amino acid ABC transporter permease [Rhodospirillaceae bacterium]|nr:branched-chain amino acid ABC transporter permease [Rhodospirillaceae bacterium]